MATPGETGAFGMDIGNVEDIAKETEKISGVRKLLTPAEKRKRRTRLHRYERAAVQLVFFVLMPGSFVAGFSGVKYLFQQISGGSVFEWGSFLTALAVLCVFTIVFGRFFCGYACAFGSLGDFVYWVSGLIQTKLLKRKRQLTLPERFLPWGQKIKYVVLAAIVILCSIGIYSGLSGWNPWSVFSSFLALQPRIAGFLPGAVLLFLILVGMAFQERFFCQFLCPMGAAFSLLPQLPFAYLKRDPETCIPGCQACKKQCPVSIKLEPDGFRNGECIGCEKCALTCPKNNLNRWDRKLFRHEAAAVLVKAVVLFAIGCFAGFLRVPFM